MSAVIQKSALKEIPGEKQRRRDIDVARGIAIICIILGHLGINNINRVVFTFHVPIFFLITGYFTKQEPMISSIKKKSKTLLVPYGITCLVMIVIAALKAIIFRGNVWETVFFWLKASLYGSGSSYHKPFIIDRIGAIWFLWASFWGYLFLQATLRLKYYLRSPFIAVIFCVGYFSAKKIFWFPLSIQAGCCAALYMYLGWCFRQSEEQLNKIRIEAKLAFAAFAMAVWIAFIVQFKSFSLVKCDFGRGMADIAGSLCACYCVTLAAKLLEKHTRCCAAALSYMGRYSLIVLCVHITELNMVNWHAVAASIPFPDHISQCLAGGMKFAIIIGATMILSNSKKIRRLFGIT